MANGQDNTLQDAFQLLFGGQTQPTPLPFPPVFDQPLGQPPPPAVAQPQAVPAQTTQQPTDTQPVDDERRRALAQLGVSLLTTGIGVGVPGALPGAAGFQTGLAETVGEKETSKFRLLDEQGDEIQSFDIKKGDVTKIQKKGTTAEELVALLAGGIVRPPEEKTTKEIVSKVRGKQESRQEFDSLESAEASNLPKGTKILVGGRKATIE